MFKWIVDKIYYNCYSFDNSNNIWLCTLKRTTIVWFCFFFSHFIAQTHTGIETQDKHLHTDQTRINDRTRTYMRVVFFSDFAVGKLHHTPLKMHVFHSNYHRLQSYYNSDNDWSRTHMMYENTTIPRGVKLL